MWMIAVLLLSSFALFLFSKIAKTPKMFEVYFWLGSAAWGVAVFLALENDYVVNAVLGLLLPFVFISDLIARLIRRRRVIPPCVRVKGKQNRVVDVIMSFVFVALVIFFVTRSLHPLGMMLLLAPMTVATIIFFILSPEKIEICRNGLWQHGKLQPWQEFRFFSWTEGTKDGLGLRLDPKAWASAEIRLLVSREDHDAVQQLLEANLPDQSSGAEDRNT